MVNEQLSILEDKLDKLSRKARPFRDRKMERLGKQANKKPEFVLVQYLRNNRTIDFVLSKVVSGNIVVIDNKGHTLNPKDTWIRGKYTWYILREKDTLPVSVRDKPKGFPTDDHPVLMKMVLGAVQKKEQQVANKKIVVGIIIAIVLGIIGWALFGG